MVWEWVTVPLAIISIAISILSLRKAQLMQGRSHHISSLLSSALLSLRKSIEQFDISIDISAIGQSDNTELHEVILSFRNKMEQSIRRIMLFGGDNEQITETLKWFDECGSSEDSIYLGYAIKFNCIQGRENKTRAKIIYEKLNKSGQ